MGDRRNPNNEQRRSTRSTVNTCVCALYFRGRQEIYDQIQKRLENRELEEGKKEKESQQTREDQEKMNLEDLKVHAEAEDTSTHAVNVHRAQFLL